MWLSYSFRIMRISSPFEARCPRKIPNGIQWQCYLSDTRIKLYWPTVWTSLYRAIPDASDRINRYNGTLFIYLLLLPHCSYVFSFLRANSIHVNITSHLGDRGKKRTRKFHWARWFDSIFLMPLICVIFSYAAYCSTTTRIIPKHQ